MFTSSPHDAELSVAWYAMEKVMTSAPVRAGGIELEVSFGQVVLSAQHSASACQPTSHSTQPTAKKV
jgi:hypothetical protein